MAKSNLSDGAADGLAAVIIVSVVVTWVVVWQAVFCQDSFDLFWRVLTQFLLLLLLGDVRPPFFGRPPHG